MDVTWPRPEHPTLLDILDSNSRLLGALIKSLLICLSIYPMTELCDCGVIPTALSFQGYIAATPNHTHAHPHENQRERHHARSRPRPDIISNMSGSFAHRNWTEIRTTTSTMSIIIEKMRRHFLTPLQAASCCLKHLKPVSTLSLPSWSRLNVFTDYHPLWQYLVAISEWLKEHVKLVCTPQYLVFHSHN